MSRFYFECSCSEAECQLVSDENCYLSDDVEACQLYCDCDHCVYKDNCDRDGCVPIGD